MTEQLNDETYLKSYNDDFVSNWDDLIGWEGREKAEEGFFHRLLDAYDVKDVADIACGTGFHAIKLAEAGFRVTASDGAPNMVKQTQANADRHGVALANCETVDWRELKATFGENAFDAVVCLGNAFTHLFDHETRRDVMENIHAVLRPGGIVIIDHRNYDDILDNGYSTKHQFYYTGDNVVVHPAAINRTLVHMEYKFPDGRVHSLKLYPLRQDYMGHLLEDVGFMDISRYGDFERPYAHYEPDFIQQVAFKPRADQLDDRGQPVSDATARRVQETQAYYDGSADAIYRDIWGENVHLGYFESEDEDLPTAMARSNVRMTEHAGFAPGQEVLDVGCGYGAFARYLAQTYGCHVLATNISEKELAWGRELTEQAGLADKVGFEYADFHKLAYDDGRFDVYTSQEAFLHAADREQVLAEAFRVLKPGGRLVFTDLLVRQDTPMAMRGKIAERVNTPNMWDTPEYIEALTRCGFVIKRVDDWSENVARTYGWVRGQLESRREEFVAKIGTEVVERTLANLGLWVDQGRMGRIGWVHMIADKPAR